MLGLFSSPMLHYGYGMLSGDARAMSDGELAQLANQWAAQQQNATVRPYGDALYAAMNYHRPVFIPTGWADWFRDGDELH